MCMTNAFVNFSLVLNVNRFHVLFFHDFNR